MVIRKAVLGDVPALAKVLSPLPLFTKYGFLEATLKERWSLAVERGEQLLVAEAEAVPVGLCWYQQRGAFAVGAYLRTLAVAESAQRKGTGKELLGAYEHACQGAPGGLFLLVSDFNLDAQRFYARHGYREVGKLPGLVKKDVTELVYWKRE
jgi:ribosomal protein S18 acetylase RimI-like enzyme